MGLILNRLKKFVKGYSTAMNNPYTQGGILEGADAVNGDFLVFGSTDGFYTKDADLVTNVKNIAGVLLATNVKVTLSYGDNPAVTTKAGESFNLMVEGFVALPLATTGAQIKEGDPVYVTADGYVANAASGNKVFTPVAAPRTADIATYYEFNSTTGAFTQTTDVAVKTTKTYFTAGTAKAAAAIANARFAKGIADTDEDGVVLANVYLNFKSAKAE